MASVQLVEEGNTQVTSLVECERKTWNLTKLHTQLVLDTNRLRSFLNHFTITNRKDEEELALIGPSVMDESFIGEDGRE